MRPRTRRSFVATALTAGSGIPLVAGAAAAAPAEKKNWIDAHVHVWTGNRKKYPISPNFRDREIKPATFLPSELLSHQRGTGVERTVLVQMSFYEFDNSYMLDVMAGSPGRFGGIAIVDDRKKTVDQEMNRLARRGVRGFRLYALADRVKDWETSEGIQKMWRTGAEAGLAMCCLTDPVALPVIYRMCERVPDTGVVIDHFARIGANGTIDQRELDRLLALAKFPNTHVKVSAFYALGKKASPYTDLAPMIRQLRDAFGSRRLMWGSDCPYQVQGEHTYRDSVSLVADRLDFLSGEEKEDILRNTAERMFFK